MSSRRRSSRLGGANLDPIPSLDDVLVENRKRSRRASSASNTEIEDKSSTATISEATIAPIVEENVELHSKNKGGNKIESKSEETPSVTLKRPRDEEEIVDESVKRAKIGKKLALIIYHQFNNRLVLGLENTGPNNSCFHKIFVTKITD